MQAEIKYISQTGNTSASWDQACHWHFHFESVSYLLLVDYISRFPVVHKLSLMTGLHVVNQCKSYNVNHITSSLHYPQSNGLAEKYIQIVKSLFYKAKEEGKDFYKCLMTYHNTPLTGTMQPPMQILQGRNATSDLPMSNATRKQLRIQPEVVRNNDKPAVLPKHDLHVGKQVMYQDSASKHWYPTVIDSLCPEPRSYKITTRDGIVYRKTQSHLKPFTSQNKNLQYNQCVSPPMA